MLATHLAIAQVTRPQGVRGEVKARPITCDPERFDALETVFLKRGEAYEARKLRFVRADAESVYLKFEGVDDRDAAEKLRGELLYVDRAHAVALPEDANFLCDLVGLRGVDDEGADWGELTEVMQPGGNDVYVFRGARGETLVPALKSVVLKVDLENRRVTLCAKRLREVAVFDEG